MCSKEIDKIAEAHCEKKRLKYKKIKAQQENELENLLPYSEY